MNTKINTNIDIKILLNQISILLDKYRVEKLAQTTFTKRRFNSEVQQRV